jgi:hypothetical protein
MANSIWTWGDDPVTVGQAAATRFKDAPEDINLMRARAAAMINSAPVDYRQSYVEGMRPEDADAMSARANLYGTENADRVQGGGADLMVRSRDFKMRQRALSEFMRRRAMNNAIDSRNNAKGYVSGLLEKVGQVVGGIYGGAGGSQVGGAAGQAAGGFFAKKDDRLNEDDPSLNY